MNGQASTSVIALRCVMALAVGGMTQANAASVPDFTGVYYPILPFGIMQPPSAGTAADGKPHPPPPPIRSAPTDDGRHGRPPNAPKLTPEYMAKWQVIRDSRLSGSTEYDPIARCISSGMPEMMAMVYGMEVQQTRDKLTIYGELNDEYRRIYLDGRKPSEKVLDDPTFAGYSTGHWEGDTLVVDTVALRAESLIGFGSFSPHSDQMTVRERIRFIEPGLLEDKVTATDPKALLEPYEVVRKYRKAVPPKDELREFSCAEGLDQAK